MDFCKGMSCARALTTLFCLVVVVLQSHAAEAGEDPIYTSLFSNHAVGGYDVTSYFEQGSPVKGDPGFETEYKGATWLFANEENLKKFRESPEQYAPQYGGYCAWAAASGAIQKGNPDNWVIYNGKLYLSLNDTIQKAWDADRDGFIARADAQWPGLLEN